MIIDILVVAGFVTLFNYIVKWISWDNKTFFQKVKERFKE